LGDGGAVLGGEPVGVVRRIGPDPLQGDPVRTGVLRDDPVVIANPYVAEARQRYAKASLRFLFTEYLCDKTGGPMVYRGRDMKTAHAGLHISEKEWRAMIADLRASMRKFNVPEKAQGDVIGVLEETKKDIVVGTAPAAPAPAAPAPAPGAPVSGAPPEGDVHQHE
jgi:hemoglobin